MLASDTILGSRGYGIYEVSAYEGRGGAFFVLIFLCVFEGAPVADTTKMGTDAIDG
jgi:hypothetical protein